MTAYSSPPTESVFAGMHVHSPLIMQDSYKEYIHRFLPPYYTRYKYLQGTDFQIHQYKDLKNLNLYIYKCLRSIVDDYKHPCLPTNICMKREQQWDMRLERISTIVHIKQSLISKKTKSVRINMDDTKQSMSDNLSMKPRKISNISDVTDEDEKHSTSTPIPIINNKFYIINVMTLMSYPHFFDPSHLQHPSATPNTKSRNKKHILGIIKTMKALPTSSINSAVQENLFGPARSVTATPRVSASITINNGTADRNSLSYVSSKVDTLPRKQLILINNESSLDTVPLPMSSSNLTSNLSKTMSNSFTIATSAMSNPKLSEITENPNASVTKQSLSHDMLVVEEDVCVDEQRERRQRMKYLRICCCLKSIDGMRVHIANTGHDIGCFDTLVYNVCYKNISLLIFYLIYILILVLCLIESIFKHNYEIDIRLTLMMITGRIMLVSIILLVCTMCQSFHDVLMVCVHILVFFFFCKILFIYFFNFRKISDIGNGSAVY